MGPARVALALLLFPPGAGARGVPCEGLVWGPLQSGTCTEDLSIAQSKELQGGQENLPCFCCLPPAEQLLLLGEYNLQPSLPILLPALNHF